MYKQAIYSSQDSERGSPSEIFGFANLCHHASSLNQDIFTQLGTPSNWSKCSFQIYIYIVYIYIQCIYSVPVYIYIYIRQIIKNNFLVPQNFGCPKASTFHCKASQDTMTSFQLAISLHIKRSVTSYNVAQHLTMQCIVLQQSITSHNVV